MYILYTVPFSFLLYTTTHLRLRSPNYRETFLLYWYYVLHFQRDFLLKKFNARAPRNITLWQMGRQWDPPSHGHCLDGPVE